MSRPQLGSAYIYLLLAFIAYMLADLLILNMRASLLPNQAPPERPAAQQTLVQHQREYYNGITGRNMFNMDGVIPPPIGGTQQQNTDDSLPVPTTISGIQLIGTLVHTNPAKSVASVKTPSSGELVGAFRVGDLMDGVGEVLAVERGRVVFRNMNNRRKEFFELPQDNRINLQTAATVPTGRQEGEVTVISDTERSIKRADLERLTSNLPELLQQARAVKDGDCFRMVDIMPGSVYERLGIRRGDCIHSVNGEAVDSPQKALEIYNQLKNSNNISLGVDRNGRKEDLKFSVQ
jgi:general secretion pathway protein C